MDVESQQKVREGPSVPLARESAPADKIAQQQLLAAHLKEADPAMYEIVENASLLPCPSTGRLPHRHPAGQRLTAPARTGEEATETLH